MVENHAQGVYQAWKSTHEHAKALEDAVNAFLATPTPESLSTARQAWIDARMVYSPTEAFRFQGGPIDGENGPEGLINGWPLDEAYVDYVVDSPGAGIINDTDQFSELTAELLVGLNEKGGEENIATGWHAIEFLLWGQDSDPVGPGARSPEDYIAVKNPGATRRALYLRLTTTLLVRHLEGLVTAWEPEKSDNYRSAFVSNPTSATKLMLTGMGMLAGDELAGERMAVAWETRDQEDEQSCFSDTTHLDIKGNLAGVVRTYTGRHGGVDGVSMKDWMTGVDPVAAQAIDAAISKAEQSVSAMQGPFDAAIQAPDDDPRRIAVGEAISAIEHLAETIAKSAARIGIQINLEGG